MWIHFATESKDTKVQWLLCFEVKILSSFALQEIVLKEKS